MAEDFDRRSEPLLFSNKNALGKVLNLINDMWEYTNPFLMIFWYLWRAYGFPYAFILSLCIYWITYFTLKYFGFDMVTGIDSASIVDPNRNNVKNWGGYFITDTISAKELRDKYFDSNNNKSKWLRLIIYLKKSWDLRD